MNAGKKDCGAGFFAGSRLSPILCRITERRVSLNAPKISIYVYTNCVRLSSSPRADRAKN